MKLDAPFIRACLFNNVYCTTIFSSDLEDLENSPGTTLPGDKIKFSKQFLLIFPVLRENYSDRSH
jgi:hypothetical protein